MALELMVLLEKNLGITLTESLVFEYPTIEDLAKYFIQTLFEDDSKGSCVGRVRRCNLKSVIRLIKSGKITQKR